MNALRASKPADHDPTRDSKQTAALRAPRRRSREVARSKHFWAANYAYALHFRSNQMCGCWQRLCTANSCVILSPEVLSIRGQRRLRTVARTGWGPQVRGGRFMVDEACLERWVSSGRAAAEGVTGTGLSVSRQGMPSTRCRCLGGGESL